METSIIDRYRETPEGREADAILRACVHCGFCTATCPTYQLLGDELDGPRGRIYLIKQVLEGKRATRRTQLHLDRCLTCRACETTCPSGVHYAHLADIGRGVVEEIVQRPLAERLTRWGLRKVLPYPARFGVLLAVGRLLRPLLPTKLKPKVPPRRGAPTWPSGAGARRMLVLEGCAQRAATPATNAAAARVLHRLGIELVREGSAGCCGAVGYHLAALDEGLDAMRRNIDAWWPHIENGAEAVIITASGCGAMVKDYGHALKDDPAYAEKAARVAALAKDISEVLTGEALAARGVDGGGRRIAFHAPCTLQHGQKLGGVVEALLTQLGFDLAPVADAHLCCGSAGTYSVLQPRLAGRLLENKLASLEAASPELIATANVGCQLHLETRAGRPVVHWIELIDQSMGD